jgi:transposase-like protein
MRHKYVKSSIIDAWRNYKGGKSYALLLAKQFKVTPAVIYNVIFQHRQKTRERTIKYRNNVINNNPIPIERKIVNKRSFKNFQSQVVFVSASNFTSLKLEVLCNTAI